MTKNTSKVPNLSVEEIERLRRNLEQARANCRILQERLAVAEAKAKRR